LLYFERAARMTTQVGVQDCQGGTASPFEVSRDCLGRAPRRALKGPATLTKPAEAGWVRAGTDQLEDGRTASLPARRRGRWLAGAVACAALAAGSSLGCKKSTERRQEEPPLCGNGRLDPGERCDDGNALDGDCCSSSCEPVACTASSGLRIAWEEVGPRSLGGRVSALAVDPGNRLHLLAGTPAGGIWRSDDGAATWAEVAPWLTAIPISALAIDPADGRVALAGTGAIDDRGSVTGGVGVLRTSDGGDTWSRSELPSHAPVYVSSVLLWPSQPGRVLAGTDTGVLASTDGGAHFTDKLQGDGISALQLDPHDPEAVYAAGRASLFRSPDRGETWVRLSSWPLREADTQGAGTVSLSPSTLTKGLLYAAVQVLATEGGTDRALLLRSTDGGKSFEALTSAPNFCPTVESCGFAQALAVDPLDDRNLLLGGDRLYVSRDAGATWGDLGSELRGVHGLALQSSGVFAFGTSGVFSLDAAFASAAARNEGLAIASVLDLDVSRESPPRLLASTADSGTLLGAGAAPSWKVVFGEGEPAGPARFDPFAPDRLFVSKAHGALYRSQDGGATFSPIVGGLDLHQEAEALAPLEPSPLVPDTLYAGRTQLFASLDAGTSWSPWRPPGSPGVFRIAPSPLKADQVYFSLALGSSIYAASGAVTTVFSLTNDPRLRIEAILPDAHSQNVIYAAGTDISTQAGRLFRSYSFGVDWQEVTPPGFPAARTLAKDDHGALYVGTAEGVFRSADDGFTWVPFNNGLLAACNRLRIAGDHLYAATAGRGVFRIPIRELVSIDSIPPGMQFLLDGKLVKGPILDAWPAGSSHILEPYLVQSEDERQEFVSWSDGGERAHAVQGTGGNQSLTVAVRASYRLRTSASPSAGGAVVVEPESADGLYASGSFVQVIASPAADHRFAGWSADLSGSLEPLAFAVVSRPLSAAAQFAPLQLEVKANPAGPELTIDGLKVAPPAHFQWEADSIHPLSAPELIDLDPADPAVLAFDHWSDLLPREHPFTLLRDAFIPDLTAEYVTTVPALDVPAGGAALLQTPGQADAARILSLEVRRGGAGPLPEPAAILSGRVGGVATAELALVPSSAASVIDTFVEGGGARGRTRLSLFNPGDQVAAVALQLRGPGGSGIVARPAALKVEPGAAFLGDLEELILLDPVYEGLLSILSDRPLHASVQSVRQNLRPSTFLDPLLLVPFTAADRNVPAEPTAQVLLRTPDTEHRLVLFNPGQTAVSGAVRAFDEGGEPLAFAGDAAQAPYEIPAGGYAAFRFRLPDAPAGGSALSTARIDLAPQGGAAPQIQLVEEQHLGKDPSGKADVILPRTLPPSRAGKRFAVPVDLSRRDSGLVLANRGDTEVPVTASLVSLAGSASAPATRAVPAGRQIALLASELFPDLAAAPAKGLLVATAPSELLGVAVLRGVNARGEALLAGWPAFDGQPAGASFQFPYLVDGDSWSTQLWLAGPADAARALLTARGLDGAPRPLPVEWP
jgi:cysteine-rich repeat protein